MKKVIKWKMFQGRCNNLNTCPPGSFIYPSVIRLGCHLFQACSRLDWEKGLGVFTELI
jgi:hypothetical protein